MKLKINLLLIAIAVGTLCFGFMGSGAGAPDLSTPQKSFSAFVDVLKSGNADALPNVATETGQVSLVALYANADYEGGMTVLGKELESSHPQFDEITEDIYFASAKVGDKVHKMEFTKEEPGWMLYHWQIGGGADQTEAEPEFSDED